MFRKLVSNLAFSPALVGQLSFYARRLRREEFTRRLGLIFTALALVVQSLVVFSPPEAANAASAADWVGGGVRDMRQFLQYYDRNHKNIKSILTSLGITRAELRNTKKSVIGEAGRYNWSMTSLYSHAQGQRSYHYKKLGGGSGTVFYRPMHLTQQGGDRHEVFVGHSKAQGWFAIKKDCGNLITQTPPKPPKQPAAICENLQVTRLAPTRLRLTVKASTKDGATVNGYVFAVTSKKTGKTTSKLVRTHNKQASYVYANDNSAVYKASVTVRSSVGPRTSADCRSDFQIKTFAECSNLSAMKLSDTSYRLTARSDVKQGVDVKKYVYVVRNSSGKVIATKSFASKRQQHSFVYNQSTPGSYRVSVTVYTSIGERSGGDCRAQFNVPTPPTPVAACVDLKATLSDRTLLSLEAEAMARNGAAIRGYTFVVKDKAGKEVKRVTISSSKTTVTAPSFMVTTPGEYTAQVFVSTSLGDKTSTDNCVAPFTVTPPEVCPYNPELPVDSPDCQPCPENPDIWIKDEDCSAVIINTKQATNVSQGHVDATTRVARAGDKIAYTVTVENTGYASEVVELKESLTDVLEYSTLIDKGGGDFSDRTKTLDWGKFTLQAGQKESRTFAVKVLDPIPTTNTGVSNESSYDCVMTNTFGNAVEVKVDCAVVKQVVEQTVEELPQTGPRENMLFAGILLAVVVYFYARARQLGTEVRLIRRDLHAGTIN